VASEVRGGGLSIHKNGTQGEVETQRKILWELTKKVEGRFLSKDKCAAKPSRGDKADLEEEYWGR